MADVDDRGQLLLVGALTFAVMLVALAVLLNAAIYTGNVATRDAGPRVGEAIEYENEATSMARATMETLNDRENMTEGELRQNFTRTVDDWSETAWVHSGASLADAEVEAVSVQEGTRISQAEQNRFTYVDWEGSTRAFRLNLSQDSLVTLNGSDYVFPDDSKPFRVRFDTDGEGSRTVHVYNRNDSDDVWVGVGGESNTQIGECSVEPTADGRVVVEISESRVNGEPCDHLQELSDRLPESYTTQFENSNQPNGSFSVVVDGSPSEVGVDPNNDAGLNVSSTIYSAELELTYRTTDVYYQTEFEVTPGEGDD